MESPSFLNRPNGETIAYHKTEGQREPGVIWLGGFKSDMGGTKALALEAWAHQNKQPYVRFDYFGHGQSSGRFEQGTVTGWRDDALAVLDELTEGKQILVGSSMGGWMSLLATLARPERVAGLVLIAPAPDFTQVMWEGFSDDIRARLTAGQSYARASAYDEDPYVITPDLIEDGKDHLLLHTDIKIDVPVRILHGMQDPDVPWQRTLQLIDKLSCGDVVISFVKDGDHRLSRKQDIARLTQTLDTLIEAL